MDNLTIEQINRIFKTKKLTWCGNFLRYDDGSTQDCYDFTFQIDEVKSMISVGEWKEHALVEVTLYVTQIPYSVNLFLVNTKTYLVAMKSYYVFTQLKMVHQIK